MTWKPCPAPQPADVIRWKEPLWAEPNKKRGKPDEIGQQLVTAKVMTLGESLQLQIEEVEILSCDAETPASSKLKPGDLIRRKKTSIDKGECEKRH